MNSSKQHRKCSKAEIGRGCSFRIKDNESKAIPSEGCYKLHETAWLDGFPDNIPTDIIEIRFKNTRRSYYQNVHNLPLERGDIVAVESSPGHDIGIVSLTGDLVAKQMKRVGFIPHNGIFNKVYRKAKSFDIERWQESIALEHETMIISRQITAEMGLNMKIGDVEYQGDMVKAIFYYIADERVDFRELIKILAERFHIRIEMKQIGARQEAGRIGGIGACGRELCCSSWISNFSSITTNSARMQEISLNPQKLAGQCSKLKCCLVYEYDTYVDARKNFPRIKEPLQVLDGEYHVVKSDILGNTISFSSSRDAMSNIVTLPISRVKEIIAINKTGKKVDELLPESAKAKTVEEPTYRSEEDSITRFDAVKRRNNRNNHRDSRNNGGDRKNTQTNSITPSGNAKGPNNEAQNGNGVGYKKRTSSNSVAEPINGGKRPHNRPRPQVTGDKEQNVQPPKKNSNEGEGGQQRTPNRGNRNFKRRSGENGSDASSKKVEA